MVCVTPADIISISPLNKAGMMVPKVMILYSTLCGSPVAAAATAAHCNVKNHGYMFNGYAVRNSIEADKIFF